jgi:hypothetical protein
LLLHLQRRGGRVAALDQDRNRGVKQLPFRGLTTLALTDPDGVAVELLAVKANSSSCAAN